MPCRRTRAPINLAARTGESNRRAVRQEKGPTSLSAALRRLQRDLESIKTAISALERLQRDRQVPDETAQRSSVTAKKKPKHPAGAPKP